jgi:hypothetical protein
VLPWFFFFSFWQGTKSVDIYAIPLAKTLFAFHNVRECNAGEFEIPLQLQVL